MAIITAVRLAEIRQAFVRSNGAMPCDRTAAAAAAQAIEDFFTANAAAIGSAIETAAPGVFTALQKKTLVAAYLLSRARADGILV